MREGCLKDRGKEANNLKPIEFFKRSLRSSSAHTKIISHNKRLD